jgi:cytochrome c oxidase assembly protein subunit 20
MAGDTRDTSSSQPQPRGPPPGASQTEPPAHIQSGSPKVYEVFHSDAPPASANALPEGSGQNTAGSKKEVPSLSEAIKTVRLEDFKQVHMYPCVRESLLMGIGGGFGIGGLRALLGGISSLLLPFFPLFFFCSNCLKANVQIPQHQYPKRQIGQ